MPVTNARSNVEREVREACLEALATFDLAPRVKAAMLEAPMPAPRAIAIGKAALSMLKGALLAGANYVDAIAVVPEGTTDPDSVASAVPARVVVAAHPVPDARSVEAGTWILELAARASGAPLDVFISGGASALACAPSAGIDLELKRAVTETLLASEADVVAINVVRRHLSRLKGGGILRAAAASPVRAFVVSDVLGGHVEDVGSGPASPDPSTREDAARVLAQFAPRFVGLPLAQGVRPSEDDAVRSTATFVADAKTFAAHLSALLARYGYAVAHGAESRGAPIGRLADEIAAAARTLPARSAIVRSVEPAVLVPPGAGRGGRATHLAVLVAARLPDDVVLCVCATDGVDGRSETGGAIVTRDIATTSELTQAAQSFDAGTLLASLDAALPAGPTGLNFADVVVLARG